MTQEAATQRLLCNAQKLGDLPRKPPVILRGATEFEQACLLLDGGLWQAQIARLCRTAVPSVFPAIKGPYWLHRQRRPGVFRVDSCSYSCFEK
jgi:hypothetical protein